MQVSARTIASLLAHIFGPSFYDDPRFGRGDPRASAQLAFGPRPEPWQLSALNPQPLPPKALHALHLADSHIEQLLMLDRNAVLLVGEAAERSLQRGIRAIAEIEELCPVWPRWPRLWPPPPPPPWEGEKMQASELLLFGTRVLEASRVAEHPSMQKALGALGEKAVGLALSVDKRS